MKSCPACGHVLTDFEERHSDGVCSQCNSPLPAEWREQRTPPTHVDYLVARLKAADELSSQAHRLIGERGRDKHRELEQAANEYDRLRVIPFKADES